MAYYPSYPPIIHDPVYGPVVPRDPTDPASGYVPLYSLVQPPTADPGVPTGDEGYETDDGDGADAAVPAGKSTVIAGRPKAHEGPTEIPTRADDSHPDVYVPPYDKSKPPKKQCQLRYDPKTGTYVAIAQWDARTGQWRTFDKEEFKEFNQGGSSVGAGKEKTIGGTTYLVTADPKTGKRVVVGVKINGKEVPLANAEMADRASGVGTKTLDSIPKRSGKDGEEFYAPPTNADGSSPEVQYLFRKDPETGAYYKVGERRKGADGKSTLHEYTLAEFQAANAAVENNFDNDLPPEDPDHPDFRSVDADAGYQRPLYRYIEGRYQLVGYQIGEEQLHFDAKTRADVNSTHVAPKSPDQLTPADLPNPAAGGDQVVPPTGQAGTTSYIFRFDPRTDQWFLMGESKTEEGGKVQTRWYDDAEFKERNEHDPAEQPPETEGEYQALNSKLICTKDSDGKVTIIGLYSGETKYYFTAKSKKLVNETDNVKGSFEENDPEVPKDVPPKAGEGALKGHPDFNSKSDRDGVFLIWRWDESVNRYCAVGEYSWTDVQIQGHHVRFKMYTNEEYQQMNSGPNRKIPPPEYANYQNPLYAPDGSNIVNTETVEGETIRLLDSPNEPPRKKGEPQSGESVTGHPIYKKLANGDKVIVGIRISKDDDGRMNKNDAPRIHYFSQQEFEYYNPGGKATTNHDVLHAPKWVNHLETNQINENNQPSYDTNGNTSGAPKH